MDRIKNTKNFLEIRPSKIHGNGVFTAKAIAAGEAFYIIPLDDIKRENHPLYTYIGGGRYVSDPAVMNNLNHSYTPTARVEFTSDPPRLIATRDIKTGEEITFDYSLTEPELIFPLPPRK